MYNSAEPVFLGGNEGGTSNPFHGELSCVRFYNRVLTADEVKDESSGASVPFKYKGANQTDLVTSNFVNNGSFPFDTFTGASANGFTAVRSTSGTKVAGTADEIVLVKGKSYRVSFDVTLTSGTFPLTRVRESQTSGTLIEIVSNGGASNGDKINFEFTATASGTYVVSFESSNSVSFAIANFNFVQIGAVAEYMGSGIASDKWLDASGNDLHGTVSGATVENAPSDDDGLVYEEGDWSPVICQSDDTDDVLPMHAETAGKYVRIGNTVTVTGQAIGNSSSGDMTASDSIAIKGLPYPVPNAQGNRSVASVLGLTVNLASGKRIAGYVAQNSSQINLYVNDGTSEGTLRFDEFTNAGHVIFQAKYII